MTDSNLVFSNKLYDIVDSSQQESAKNAWLAASISDYVQLNTQDRWRRLMACCAPLFSVNKGSQT